MTENKHPILRMTVGIQGSGKSTWAKKFIADNPDYVYVNPDSVWTRIGDITDRSLAPVVYGITRGQTRDALEAGKNVLVDATNTRRRQRTTFLKISQEVNAWKIAHVFRVDRDVAIARIRERVANGGMNVPDEVVDDFLFYFNNTPPDHSEFDEIIEMT